MLKPLSRWRAFLRVVFHPDAPSIELHNAQKRFDRCMAQTLEKLEQNTETIRKMTPDHGPCVTHLGGHSPN